MVPPAPGSSTVWRSAIRSQGHLCDEIDDLSNFEMPRHGAMRMKTTEMLMGLVKQ